MILGDRDRQAVIFANEAFYAAFAAGDIEAMRRCWADDGPIACIHPGWEPLYDRQEIMRSWASILRAPPPVACHDPRVIGEGAMAAVVCYEGIEGQYLIATNMFRRQDDGWRMVHHHGGPTRGRPEPATGQSGRTVN